MSPESNDASSYIPVKEMLGGRSVQTRLEGLIDNFDISRSNLNANAEDLFARAEDITPESMCIYKDPLVDRIYIQSSVFDNNGIPQILADIAFIYIDDDRNSAEYWKNLFGTIEISLDFSQHMPLLVPDKEEGWYILRFILPTERRVEYYATLQERIEFYESIPITSEDDMTERLDAMGYTVYAASGGSIAELVESIPDDIPPIRIPQ